MRALVHLNLRISGLIHGRGLRSVGALSPEATSTLSKMDGLM